MNAHHLRHYRLNRYTVIMPDVDNRGEASHYPEAFHAALIDAGFNFTTYQTRGVWKGETEPGTLFEILHSGDHHKLVKQLGSIARRVATDQEAIQVTYDPVPTTVYEA
jgi:hypothetical protein